MLHDIIWGLSSWHAARFVVQATVSALATFALASLLGLTETSWAIISALFAVHTTVGGSLSSAFDRVVGASLGAMIGILVLATIGYGEWRSVAAIGIAVAATSWLIGALPSLQYGLVTVAILVVSPGGDLVEAALHKLAAIALGAVVGSLCSAVIFPARAHRNAERHLCLAVKRCCSLLEGSTQVLMGRGSFDFDAVNDDIRGHVARAQAFTSQSQVLRLHRRSRRPTPNDMLRAVERLWYTLTLIDRLSSEQLPRLDPARLEGPVEDALGATCRYLGEIAAGMATNRRVPPPDPVSLRIGAMRETLGDVCDLRNEAGMTKTGRERLFAFSFAWGQIDRTICEIAALMEIDPGRSRDSEAAGRTLGHDAAASAG